MYPAKYRKICFSFHEKKCIICGEELWVETHHFDGDRTHNDPSNLIPLCANHHHYWHSKYRYLIEEIVIAYRKQFLENLCEDYPFEQNEDLDLT